MLKFSPSHIQIEDGMDWSIRDKYYFSRLYLKRVIVCTVVECCKGLWRPWSIVLHMMLCIAFVLLQPQIGQQKNTEILLSSRIVGALQSAFDQN
jgi:hypothetical protein